jgi:hypothetical protein
MSDSFTSGERTWVWNGTTWSNTAVILPDASNDIKTLIVMEVL